MSTIALDYSNNLHVQRNSILRWIFVFIISLVLFASVILVATITSVSVDATSGMITAPVPVAPQ
jgi:hypothetical protein